MRKHEEDNIQVSCVEWFRYQYPKLLLTSFPAGFALQGDKIKRIRTGARMKQMGYENGTPDLLIAVSNRVYHGLFIEMKTEKGKLTENQIKIGRYLHDNGYQCLVVRSLDEFIKVVEKYLKQ